MEVVESAEDEVTVVEHKSRPKRAKKAVVKQEAEAKPSVPKKKAKKFKVSEPE